MHDNELVELLIPIGLLYIAWSCISLTIDFRLSIFYLISSTPADTIGRMRMYALHCGVTKGPWGNFDVFNNLMFSHNIII
jgi:hypothetical protein